MSNKLQRIPPDIQSLLRVLQTNDVAFVVVGSVAIQAWGVDVGTPGDLDVVPDTSVENLGRLATALRSLEAESWPITGRWRQKEGCEFQWEQYPEDHPSFGTTIDAPDPADITTFDSLFRTCHGELDIVPVISGHYDDLAPRAHRMEVHGVRGISVMSIEDLLTRLTVPRRAKDASRVAGLRAVQCGQDVQKPSTWN